MTTATAADAAQHVDDDPIVVISSDGHAGAVMADYRPYLDPGYREEFDDFVVEWDRYGTRNFDPPALEARLDPDAVARWRASMVDTGRIDGYTDPRTRLVEVEKEGICAEVLFPDFGLPFELYSRGLAAGMRRKYDAPDEAHRQASYRAFNRWLADYVRCAPERFFGVAIVGWNDVQAAVDDLRSAHANGLRGVVLPEFSPERPMYHPDFEPVWDVVDELGLVVHSHAAISGTSDLPAGATGDVPHPALSTRVWHPELWFRTHHILRHLVWGGVLERHPSVRFVFTEQGSGWVVPALVDMDHHYDAHYRRRGDGHRIRSKPSEYFARQCFLGSSLFSREEIRGRHRIGVDKMMLGMDYPHHEGTMIETTQEYLRATLGAEGVPLVEARRLLGVNAAGVYDFDLGALRDVAARIGVRAEHLLAPPERDLFPRGDVRKPATLALVGSFTGA